MKVLLIGDGAREHAMAEALAKSNEVYSLMQEKNPAIAKIAKESKIDKEIDCELVEKLIEKWEIDYFIPGPITYNWKKFVESLSFCKTKYSGATAEASRIGTEQSFFRELMQRNECPGRITYGVFDDIEDANEFIEVYGKPVAVRPIDLNLQTKLMSGHGGQLTDIDSVKNYVKKLIGKEKNSIVIEELVEGEEFSLAALIDGKFVYPLHTIHESRFSIAKQKGRITPGMGGYYNGGKLLPFMIDADYVNAVEIIQSIVNAMDREGIPYQGELTTRFILSKEGPKVIEIMIGLGDPGATLLLPQLETSYGEICEAIIEGELENMNICFDDKAAICKYVIPKGYPRKSTSSKLTIGKGKIYYNSVEQKKDLMYTTQKRTLVCVGTGHNLKEAEKEIDETLAMVKGKIYYRKDIGTENYINGQIQKINKIRSEEGKLI